MVKYISDRIAVMHFGKIVELDRLTKFIIILYMIILNHYYLLSLNPIDSERTRKRIVYEEDESKMQNVDCKKLDLIITFL